MKLWVGMLLFCASAAQASTFVGNGGGAGDVELATTKKQIEESFMVIQRRVGDDNLNLCRCNHMYESRSVCDPLRSLTSDQRKFCTATLFKQTEAILSLVNNPNAVSIRWTHEEIRVADRGETRAVDAVTNREKREMTINLKRFMDMKPFERVFLVTHELMHLTDLDSKPMVDEGPVGPFSGDQGGRQLLNAMGSAVGVMQGEYPREIRKYRGRLLRSQSWKPIWLDINVGKADLRGEREGTFAAEKFNRTQLSARYALGNWVFTGSYRSETEDQKVLDTITVNEKKYIYGLGIGYRFFPFGDPETYWGQSHFLLQGMVDYIRTDLNLTDGVKYSGHAHAMGANLSLNYYIPFFWGFWWYVGAAYEVHPYKYKDVNLEYKENIVSTYLGAAYAF